jgi:hypothetical protein
MTDAGCPVSASALFKIEKSDPPRKISVDELVALAMVFDTTINDLLTPLEMLDDKRATELARELDETEITLAEAAEHMVWLWREAYGLGAGKEWEQEIHDKLKADGTNLLHVSTSDPHRCSRQSDYTDEGIRQRVAGLPRCDYHSGNEHPRAREVRAGVAGIMSNPQKLIEVDQVQELLDELRRSIDGQR